MIGKAFNSMFTFLGRLGSKIVQGISDALGYLFQKLFDFLKWLFRPLFIVIALIFYFIYKIAALALLLIKALLAVGKLIFALVKGIFVTLAGFTFTPTNRSDGQWTSLFHNVVDGLGSYQLDNIAYVLMFLIWFATAFAAIRIIGSFRQQ